MSRIGKTAIQMNGATLNAVGRSVTVTGPKGSVNVDLPLELEMNLENGRLQLQLLKNDAQKSNLYGLSRALLQNAVLGVTKGWEKNLELVGVGYKAGGGGAEIVLNVGYTHPVKITAPQNVSFTVTDNTKIKVLGIDKKVVGETAAKIRAVKPPEPYKGKGIRYAGEIVRKKAGKAVKAVGGTA